PDTRWFATAGADGIVFLCDANTGVVQRSLAGHSGAVHSLTFSPNARRLISGAEDATARIWDVEAGREVTRLTGHVDAVNAVGFAPSGRRLVTLGANGLTVVWDAESGEALHSHRLPGCGCCAAVAPDATRVAVGTGTSRVFWVDFPSRAR